MAKKTTTNFNALRSVIIEAHNGGNHKAISKDMVSGAGIDNEYFVMWCNDCNKLRLTVADYVLKKRAKKYGYEIAGKDVTDKDISKAREAIFPAWKEILQTGENSKDARELKVDVDDVEDLIGFVWDFMDSGRGTVEHIVTENIFRKKVESLLGCAIAKNAVLEDGDRDTLTAFRSAEKRIANAKETTTELKNQKEALENLKKSLPATEKKFAEYLNTQLAAIDEEISATADAKAKAEKDKKAVAATAKEILNRIRYAK